MKSQLASVGHLEHVRVRIAYRSLGILKPTQSTVHPQVYDTDKGDGQLDYVISAKRCHYYTRL